jgi:NDP-sugar pyrophosphorylase family protein
LINEVIELAQYNTLYDIFSILISKNVKIGKGNIIYPNVIIECNDEHGIIIGDNNILYNGCSVKAKSGKIEIGNHNEIGENGVFISSLENEIKRKNNCRLMNGAQILDGCIIGNGCQVLGNIKAVKCILQDGESYEWDNPNMRGGVLKGFGSATELLVDKGEVIFGKGLFSKDMIEKQEKYHPNWKNKKSITEPR